MTKYSICIKNHIVIADKINGDTCPTCGRQTTTTTLKQAASRMNLHAYRYSVRGQTGNLRLMERWSLVVELIERMEQNRATKQSDNENH